MFAKVIVADPSEVRTTPVSKALSGKTLANPTPSPSNVVAFTWSNEPVPCAESVVTSNSPKEPVDVIDPLIAIPVNELPSPINEPLIVEPLIVPVIFKLLPVIFPEV